MNVNDFYTELARQEIKADYLYRYSVFFRNYIQNVAEDVLKNGIELQGFNREVSFETLDQYKVSLKQALFNCVISSRFYGVGYILINTNDDLELLENPVNNELPIDFTFLRYDLVKDEGIDSEFIEYSFKEESYQFYKVGFKTYKIHKSRLIIYGNYNYIINSYEPCYTQSFLLDIYLLELIFCEINKQIPKNNFLYYKDQCLGEIEDSRKSKELQMNILSKPFQAFGSLFSKLVKKQDGQVVEQSYYGSSNNSLSDELQVLKDNLNNQGMFFTSSEGSDMKVIQYDIKYLKEAFELIKRKIGADTKEPLTRSFNEQTKGLGNDGKGDRSNYYDFLKGIQENIENACNIKLNKYFGLDIRFNSLIILNEMEKIQHDVELLELYSKYQQLANSIGIDNLENIKDNLFNADIFNIRPNTKELNNEPTT